jgi:hypothetical protein
MANQVINCEHWLDKKGLILHLGCGERWIEYRSTPQQARRTFTGGDGRPALTHAAASRRGRGGLRSEGDRDIEAMGAEREDEAKP